MPNPRLYTWRLVGLLMRCYVRLRKVPLTRGKIVRYLKYCRGSLKHPAPDDLSTIDHYEARCGHLAEPWPPDLPRLYFVVDEDAVDQA